jgi:hypothetical protein
MTYSPRIRLASRLRKNLQLGNHYPTIEVSWRKTAGGQKCLLSEFGFALRLAIWLCLLPVRPRFRPLPELLKRHSSAPRRFKRRSAQEPEPVVCLFACHLPRYAICFFLESSSLPPLGLWIPMMKNR